MHVLSIQSSDTRNLDFHLCVIKRDFKNTNLPQSNLVKLNVACKALRIKTRCNAT